MHRQIAAALKRVRYPLGYSNTSRAGLAITRGTYGCSRALKVLRLFKGTEGTEYSEALRVPFSFGRGAADFAHHLADVRLADQLLPHFS